MLSVFQNIRCKWSARTLSVSALFIAAFGCSSAGYNYKPAPAASMKVGEIGEKTSAIYEVGKNEGTINIVSFGPVELNGPGMPGIRTMKMRVIVKNEVQSADPNKVWVLNTGQQWISFPDHGSSQPAYINTDNQTKLGDLPMVKILPGQSKVVDLYYPLPRRFQTASEIPKFSFQWKLHAGSVATGFTTVFDRFLLKGRSVARIDIRDLSPSDGVAGGPWWKNGEYTQNTFKDGPVFV
jgi:hypothetical protein